MNKENVTRPYKGLHTDSSPQDQPKNTYRFALNAVNESEEGDVGFLSNEESNEFCSSFGADWVILGSVYINDGQTVVFLVNEAEDQNQIVLIDDNCTQIILGVGDLGFRISNQIDATFRLRRGCERVVYFTDGLNPPRLYNLDKPQNFVDGLGFFIPAKFDLIKNYESIPEFDDITIIQGGNLLPGSYNFAIQYLDEDLNPTEWITTSDTIIIYNDSTSKDFASIRGSTNEVTDWWNFGATSKAIKLNLSNFDPNFPFYRIAVIEATTGSGEVSRVTYSPEKSTSNTEFIFSTLDGYTEGTEEEVQQFSSNIETVDHIEQLENRLLLGGIKGKDINWCRFQKYASQIKADLIYKTVILNNTDFEDNPKRGELHFEDLGYMPGELYSFGLVYVFSDGSVSPAFHIPGRNPSYDSEMSTNNESSSDVYTESISCTHENFWGVDSQGDALVGEPVRHHRFPLRNEVQKPLFTTDTTTQEVVQNCLYLDISGTIDTGTVTGTTIDYIVRYTVNGVPTETQLQIVIANYDDAVGLNNILVDCSLDPIVFTEIKEIDDMAMEQDPASWSTLTYTERIETVTTITNDIIYSAEIMGIKFSDIPVPDPSDLNGNEVVGYYIVRHERDEENKTILDNGILTPLLVEERSGVERFVAHGHLAPAFSSTNLKEDIFAMIHPEHKFRDIEYTDIDDIIQEGYYTINSGNKYLGSDIVQDVQPGSSYDPTVAKRREEDQDGYDLHILTRNHDCEYFRTYQVLATGGEVENTFYLDPLHANGVEDVNMDRKDIYNLSSDNRVGFLQLNKSLNTLPFRTQIPYIVMRRNLANPYTAMRTTPYYKEFANPVYFVGGADSEVDIFNGDSYISSMRYFSSMHYDIRLRLRDSKDGTWYYVFGIVLAVVAVVAGIYGEEFIAFVAVLGALYLFERGASVDQMKRVYLHLYQQGLQDTVDDADTNAEFSPNPPDDEIQWFFDVLSNIWVESSVNMNWRHGVQIGGVDFLNAPSGYNEPGVVGYALDKVSTIDPASDGGRTTLNITKPEIYKVNKDYRRRDKQKLYYPLEETFDCCSDCQDQFPHRIYWSEQSFQEERSDNYRVILANNYRDIEGNSGVITNLFRIQNNLYVHTQEALWHLPQNIQERVTGDVISFIGTGEFFSIPPRKIVDDDTGMSAGSEHKWGTVKTPHGVFFPSERQKTFFQFDGNKLIPIGADGMFSWFKENAEIKQDREYYRINRRPYPYRDNPVAKWGTGYTSTYDSRKERVIFTKKDLLFGDPVTMTGDYEVCVDNGQMIVFENYLATIAAQELAGWTFIGIEDCQLCFQRITTTSIDVDITTTTPNNLDVHVFYDTSGSFGGITENCLVDIDQAVQDWLVGFQISNPAWSGTLYTYNDSTERWLNYPQILASTTYFGQSLATKDILVISFCNESDDLYHDNLLDNPIVGTTAQWDTDHANFLTLHAAYNSFIGIMYPIVFGASAGMCGAGGGGDIPASRNFLLHSIAAWWGDSMTAMEVATELPTQNPGFTAGEWTTLETALQAANPYQTPGLKDYDWYGKWDRAADSMGNVINSFQFGLDIEEFLEASSSTSTQSVLVPTIEYTYIAGTPVADPEEIRADWTLSYSVKFDSWTSWHSYTPGFYMHTPDKFYSWTYGIDPLYVHNKENEYQNFYGTRYPFIVDYVSLSDPLQTRIWDHITLHTEARKYFDDVSATGFYDEREVTFNKAIFYNSRQSSGLLNLVVKGTETPEEDYLQQQVNTLGGDSVHIDRNERNWTINELRDYVVDYSIPMFNIKLEDLQTDYYIDKIVNPNAMNLNKQWYDTEPFKDKYLRIRMIFDNLDDVKLMFNYSLENEKPSYR